MVARLRRDRPEPEFTISMRTHWDGKDVGGLRTASLAMPRPAFSTSWSTRSDRDVDDWDTVIEGTGRVSAV